MIIGCLLIQVMGVLFLRIHLNVRIVYKLIRGGSREDKSYSNPAIYTKDYGHFIMRQMGDYAYFNVHAAEGMLSDFMFEPETYYRNVHVLMKLDLKSGKIENLLGGYPPFIMKKDCIFFSKFHLI